MDRITESAISELERICPLGVQRNVSLREISQWRIGGVADIVIRPSSLREIANLREWFNLNSIKHVVIGATSNLLFSDEGLFVPCIQIGSKFASFRITGNTVEASAGVWIPRLARNIMNKALTGAEHICGIPGTLGGLVCMNGGSQRKGIGSNIKTVVSVNTFGNIVERESKECEFSYRESIFQTNNEIIAEVKLCFENGKKDLIRNDMLRILKERNSKFPRKVPNCGSVFKSNPLMYDEIGPPGAIIEKLGFKGMQEGGALVSPHHANFIVNTGAARAYDVLQLVSRISEKVFRETGFTLSAEVLYVDKAGESIPLNKAW